MCHLGLTPLHSAAQKGHLDNCAVIVKYASEKNPIRNYRMTTLHIALYKGHLEICKILIYDAADESPKDNQGMTPIHFATKYGHMEVYKYVNFLWKRLLRKNQGVIQQTHHLLRLAKKNKHFETASLICSAKASFVISMNAFWQCPKNQEKKYRIGGNNIKYHISPNFLLQ